MERVYLILIILFASNYLMFGQGNQLFEAENNILSGEAEITNCNNASGGQMVKGLDNGLVNSLLFDSIEAASSGEYFVTVSYYSVNARTLSYKVNNGDAQSESIDASGAWCYQGGTPADHIFKIEMVEGNNNLLFYNSPIIDKIIVSSDTSSRVPSAIYISSGLGNDQNDGLTPETAIQSLNRLNSFKLLPGDSVLFKAGESFVGKLQIQNESGTELKPIVFSRYGTGDLPLLDGNGYLSTIDVVNSGYLHFSNLEIKNDGGPAQAGNDENLRYGIYFQNSYTDGTVFKHYRMKNLVFKNIYPTIEVTDDDNTGVNAHAIFTSGSWGDDQHPLRFDDMQVLNCYFTRTARHALVIKATNNLIIRNNYFEHVGGAGMVIGNACNNILVEKNITNHTGSSIDSRMAGRGSGIWCYRTTNLTVQHNQFMFARGIHDSYGMHIDIGNHNVVYQYNYSVGNEGGFVEILGMNRNIGYRYNLSIADGWRKRGNRFGQIFWLAGWSGDPKNPVGSDSIFVYNNSIYVPDTISPGIWIESVSENARIYNNIIQVENEFGPVVIKNAAAFNDFDYNIWSGNIPTEDEDGESYRGANALTADPLFANAIVKDSMGFILSDGSPAFGTGKLIYNASVNKSFDGYDNNGGVDFYGNAVSNELAPNRGAYNGIENGVEVQDIQLKNTKVLLYPNPVSGNEQVTLKISSDLPNEKIKVQLFDLRGKLILNRNYDSNSSIQIDTNGLFGVYLVRIIADHFISTQKLEIH